jgi:hypothetical protein
MKARAQLWVRLKVVDLVTQTAWLTLTEKLEFENDLCGLVRYSFWGMDAEGAGRDEIIDELDRVIRMDSAFTNQNKHLYRLSVAEVAQDDGTGDGAASYGVTTGAGGEGSSGTVRGASKTASAQGGSGAVITALKGDLAIEEDYPMQVVGRGSAAGRDVFAFDCLIRERQAVRETGYMSRLNNRLEGVEITSLKAGEVWRIIVYSHSREEALENVERMVVTRSRKEGLLLNPHYQVYEFIADMRLEGGGG